MTSFIYNSPEILGLIKKSQDMKPLPSGWDKDNFDRFKSFLDDLKATRALFAIPVNREDYNSYKYNDQKYDTSTLSKFDQILNKLTAEYHKKYDQTSIAEILNELTELHNSSVISKFDGWIKSEPVFKAYKDADANFIRTLSGLKGLAGFTQTKSLSESYSNQLEQLIESLHQKYNEVNDKRDISGALSAFFNGKVPEKDKALKNISDIISRLSDLNIYIKSGDYQSTNTSINAINMFLTANQGLFNNDLVNQINSITSNIKTDATRNGEASKTISKEVSDVVTALLDRLSNQSANDLNPKSNVTGNESPKLKDIDDGFSYIKYLYDNQFKVNGELIVKPVESSIIDKIKGALRGEGDKPPVINNKNGWRVIDLSDKVPGGGIVQFNVNLLKSALLDIQRQARTSQDKLFIDLVGHLALDCQYFFSVNANIGANEIDASMVLDSIQNPLKDFNDLTNTGSKKVFVADLKDKNSFDNWLSGLTYAPTTPDDKAANGKPDSCVVLNYLYKRAGKKDRAISKTYIELLTAIMQSTSCVIDSNNTGGKGKGQGDGNNEGSASQNQTGSRTPAEALAIQQQAANYANASSATLPFQENVASIIRFQTFALNVIKLATYLSEKYNQLNTDEAKLYVQRFSTVNNNANKVLAFAKELTARTSTTEIHISSGNILKNYLISITGDSNGSPRDALRTANDLNQLFTQGMNLVDTFNQTLNADNSKPVLTAAVTEQRRYFEQHIRAVADAKSFLDVQIRNMR